MRRDIEDLKATKARIIAGRPSTSQAARRFYLALIDEILERREAEALSSGGEGQGWSYDMEAAPQDEWLLTYSGNRFGIAKKSRRGSGRGFLAWSTSDCRIAWHPVAWQKLTKPAALNPAPASNKEDGRS